MVSNLLVDDRLQFDDFVQSVRGPLTRALAVRYGADQAADATASALAYAWEHWDDVRFLTNPRGYLFRVAQSSTRQRKVAHLPAPEAIGVPQVEPALIPALLSLPEPQRVAVWLVHACQWTYSETAEAMGIGTSTVGTHVQRGMATLRQQLHVEKEGTP